MYTCSFLSFSSYVRFRSLFQLMLAVYKYSSINLDSILLLYYMTVYNGRFSFEAQMRITALKLIPNKWKPLDRIRKVKNHGSQTTIVQSSNSGNDGDLIAGSNVLTHVYGNTLVHRGYQWLHFPRHISAIVSPQTRPI